MSNRQDMINEANSLGLEFKGNISNIALAKLISDFKGEPEPVDEVAPDNPAMNPEFAETDELSDEDLADFFDEDVDPEPEPDVSEATKPKETESIPPGETVPATQKAPVPLTPRQRAEAAVQQRYAAKRNKISDARGRAMRKKIVTLTNKDNRENEFMTTAYLAFENQHFGIARLVPLDVPVELEVALVKIAARTTMTLHKDEIVDGKRTGNKVPVRVKKYAISYSRQDPE